MNYYKQVEIEEYTKEALQERLNYDPDYLSKDFSDIHNELFNEDYYIIGTYEAKQWLGSDAFNCIGDIQEYEKAEFGESYTDLSDPEKVVNMYVYLVGEHILQDVIDEVQEEIEDN